MHPESSFQQARLGLRENWPQFVLLIMVNALVGGMVGMERSIFPQFADEVFGLSSRAAVLSFIAAFGFSKALANYFTGRMSNRFGRKRLLLWGWALAIPVPLLLMHAGSWNVVVFANVLLGASQGLTWSSTVVMKIDLVGERNRGLAMGLNEFAGYLSVGLVAFLTGLIADRYGVTPYPFYLGLGIALAGFLTTWLWIRDTRHHVAMESANSRERALEGVFVQTTFKDRTLSTVTQAGLVNNLNDGMIWGLLPMLLIGYAFDSREIGTIAAIYPAVWGIGQLFTGRMADLYARKAMLFWGMLLQGVAILWLPFTGDWSALILLAAALGLGTALVYPTFLTTIAAVTRPGQRAESIGVFRLWRDLGYAFGAIASGWLADRFGLETAILAVGLLTLLSALVIGIRMPGGKRLAAGHTPLREEPSE